MNDKETIILLLNEFANQKNIFFLINLTFR